MSRVHDALRRGRRSTPDQPSPDRPSAHADAVLATLGYRRSPQHRSAGRAARVMLILGLLGSAAYVAWSWLQGPGQSAAPRITTTTASASVPSPGGTRGNPNGTPRAEGDGRPPAPTHDGSRDAIEKRAPSIKRAPPNAGTAATARKEALPSASPPSATAAAPARDDFDLALYYQRAGEFDQALLHYRAVLQRNELNVEAHNNLGLLYEDKGLLDDAAREFERALYIDPRYLRARNNLGVTRRAQGRFDAAAAEFRAVLAQDPRNVDAMVNLALVQTDAGQIADARGSLVSALTIDPRNAPAHYNLAVQYEQLGEAARAVEHYRAFLQHAGPEYVSRAADVRRRIDSLSNRIK